MKRIVLTLAVMLLALPAMAQEEATATTTAPPDYSKDTLTRLFSEEITVEAPRDRNFKAGFGYIDFRALGMRWHIGYLPFLAPMQGSQQWRVDHRWPDPFILTGSSLATTPRSFARSKEVSAELRKLEKRLKKDAQIVAKPE